MALDLTRLSEEKDMGALLSVGGITAALLATASTMPKVRGENPNHSIAGRLLYANDRDLGCALAAKDAPKSVAA